MDNINRNNFYSLKVKAWHGKGIVGEENETAQQVYGRMDLVEFQQHPFQLIVEGSVIANNMLGIIRKQGGKISLVGNSKDKYDLKQPIDYILKFDEMVGKPVETLGFLGSKAEKLFITWNLPEIDIRGDRVEMYGLLSFGFDGKYGNHLFATSVRTVCQNTHAMAVADAAETNNHGRGKNSNNAIVTTRHNQKNHLDTLGYWMKYVDKESERQVENIRFLFLKMQEKPLSLDEAYGFFSKVYPVSQEKTSFIPPELISKRDETLDKQDEKQKEYQDLAMSLFSGAGIEIEKNIYGAYNTITEINNHHIQSRKNDGVDSLILGDRAKVMNSAWSLAKEMVLVDYSMNK